MTTNVTWIVFGDDWGAHPSTTQHLILNMPADHSAIWIDSIGMRTPSINLQDFRRLLSKGSDLMDNRAGAANRLYKGSVGQVERLKPRVLPWHRISAIVNYNNYWLKKEIEKTLSQHHANRRILLTANPVVAYYCDVLEVDTIIYLRLDDYSEYPGCDPELVADAEAKVYAKADLIIATARSLLPLEPFAAKGRYLPQGVHTDAFSSVPVEPPRKPVLGFFGSVAEWLDFDLIESVATLASEWCLEFIGKADFVPETLRRHKNILIHEPVPFHELPSCISNWAAAWIPFKINELTISVNPLKIREYLAAGLPTHCTPLPEAQDLSEHVFLTSNAERIVAWLRKTLTEDSVELRQKRRAAVAGETWKARAAALVAYVDDLK